MSGFLDGLGQHGPTFRPGVPSPLNCSRVMSHMRMSKSTFDKWLHAALSRRERSALMTISLLSTFFRSGPRGLASAIVRGLLNFRGITLVPLLAARLCWSAEAEKGNRSWLGAEPTRLRGPLKYIAKLHPHQKSFYLIGRRTAPLLGVNHLDLKKLLERLCAGRSHQPALRCPLGGSTPALLATPFLRQAAR